MKNRYSAILQYISLGILLLLTFSCASMPARTELGEPKSDLFVSTKDLMDRAVSARADELAPQVYYKGVQYYLDAEKDFEKGKDIAKVQKNLDKAQKYAENSIDVSQTMKNSFPDLIERRDKAISAGADQMDLKSYKQAEKFFLRTSADVEDNGMEGARKNAEKALKEFDKAELKAIQNNVVGNLEAQLKQAEKSGAGKWSPETFETAKNYKDDALKTLEQDRYNDQVARQQVDQGEYYTRKAQFLTEKIKEAKGDKENWEKLFLQREEDLSKIASPLNIEPSFDEGFDKPVSEIDQAVRELRQKEQVLNAQLMQTQQSLAQARQDVRQAERTKEKISSELQMSESALQQRKMAEQKVKNIQNIFSSEQAKVNIDPGNNVTITLYGLNFETGKASVKPEFYPLLANVEKAAQMFPDRKIKVIGHTDSVGSSEFNQRLSLERAQSVAQFMQEELGVPSRRMEVIGAGESEPIAPNTTKEGRALNRRIDVTFIAP